MSTWSGAELRARLAYLGLSVATFSLLTGRSQRYIERVSTGRVGSVSEKISSTVMSLEAQAEEELARWDEATEEGTPIGIPRLNTGQEEGELPPHWYLALAGHHIEKWSDKAQIKWQSPCMTDDYRL